MARFGSEYIIGPLVAVLSLFSGASVMHNIMKPDLTLPVGPAAEERKQHQDQQPQEPKK
ncbi:hypothetical protein DUNSADRAFT_6780 [Dunaliella salina]|uniref:Uncharacterized protein n=1 Tax=Dunaliella salina TaxID=3046 RepID=A0ABQ7H6P9_DUNSA|nr:hypothetical protein DUNSADRAFT_6780 [Dunaliella salina]|eukprot:KAF5842536.1 hypothetical protein DUNSADRAFT_6780 [Dunaliella salina]